MDTNFEFDKNKGYIYCLTSPSGKCYIGQSWDFKNRIRRYKAMDKSTKECHPKFYNALKKYGFENFIISILDSAKTQKLLDKKEQYWIASFDSMKNGYNCTEGGMGGKKSEETKKRIGEGQLGPKNHRFGKKNTKKMKKAASDANKGKNNYFYGKPQNGKNNGFYGKTHTTEWRRYKSEERKKFRHTKETKKKIGEKSKIHIKSPEERQKLSESAKKRWIELKKLGKKTF